MHGTGEVLVATHHTHQIIIIFKSNYKPVEKSLNLLNGSEQISSG